MTLAQLSPEAQARLRAAIADERTPLAWIHDDGGRSRYFTGDAGDCVTRAIAIAAELDYRQVYDDLFDVDRIVSDARKKKVRSPRNGVRSEIFRAYLDEIGWQWTPLVTIGTGITVHLAEGELPPVPRLIARCSKHLVAVIDGIVRDTHDPSRDGTRAVYGYWTPRSSS